ncbi:MAG TPA: hypothetical protein VL418_14875 [Devosiaceae bacterium]|nr:hypothetical protein [Devosiaceae bacterium]
MTMLLPLSKIVRAAILALAVSGAVLSAVPAQAQYGGGSGGGGSSRSYDEPRSFDRPSDRGFNRRVCLSEGQLRRDLNRRGFRNITFFSFGNVRVQARAVRGPWVYRLTVNRCSGDIIGMVRAGRR